MLGVYLPASRLEKRNLTLRLYVYLGNIKWFSIITYGNINTRDVVKLEKSVTNTQAEGECFLAFRKFRNIPSVYITVHKH